MSKSSWVMMLLLGTAVFPCTSDGKDFSFTDLQITGQLEIGTKVPRARLDLDMSPSDLFGLKIVGPSGAPLFTVDNQGRVASGVELPDAHLDVRHGIMLRSGAATLDSGGAQVLFSAKDPGSSQFSIRTRHNPTDGVNAIDFYFSPPFGRGDVRQGSYGSRALRVLSLEGKKESNSCAIGVSPVGNAEFELDISSGGGVPGGGVMRCRSTGEWTSKKMISEVKYLGKKDEAEAYDEVKGLRHASFRYKTWSPAGYADPPSSPVMRGLTYEDAPESIRGSGKTLIEDYRVLNLELALKEINRKIAEVEAKISKAEKRR